MPGEAPMALDGYRVLDLTGEIGQYAGRALAEMGAEVIKVDPPEGDPVRRIGPFFRDEPRLDRSLLWFVLNAGKRGITCNVERPEGRYLLERLVGTTDLVIESFRPGYLDDLGLGYERFLKAHPRLVWVSVTGFGQDGPYRDYAWSDLVGLALGGLLYLWGEPDRPPVRARAAQAYYQASLAAALGASLALYHARRTGEGQHVDVSMQEVVTFSLAGPGGITGYWSLEGRNIARSGPSMNLGDIQSRIFFPCKDGYVAIGAVFGPHLETLVELMKRDGAADLLLDPKWLSATRFAPLPGQWRCTQEEADAVEDEIARWLQRYTREQILQIAREHDLLIFPVRAVWENLDNEQLRARDYFQEVDHPELGTGILYPGPPVVLSETPWRIRGRAPLLGEHNREVYGSLGFTNADLETLHAVGAI